MSANTQQFSIGIEMPKTWEDFMNPFYAQAELIDQLKKQLAAAPKSREITDEGAETEVSNKVNFVYPSSSSSHMPHTSIGRLRGGRQAVDRCEFPHKKDLENEGYDALEYDDDEYDYEDQYGYEDPYACDEFILDDIDEEELYLAIREALWEALEALLCARRKEEGDGEVEEWNDDDEEGGEEEWNDDEEWCM